MPEDLAVVEGEAAVGAPQRFLDLDPVGLASVARAGHLRRIRHDRQKGGRDDPTPGVTLRARIRVQLFQPDPGAVQPGLLPEFPLRRVLQRLSRLDEPAGQGELPAIRSLAAPHEQDSQLCRADREDHDVGCRLRRDPWPPDRSGPRITPGNDLHQVARIDDGSLRDGDGQVLRRLRIVDGHAAFMDAPQFVRRGAADVSAGIHDVHQVRGEDLLQGRRLEVVVRGLRRVGLEAHEIVPVVDDPADRRALHDQSGVREGPGGRQDFGVVLPEAPDESNGALGGDTHNGTVPVERRRSELPIAPS